MKRVSLFKNGSTKDGKAVLLSTFPQLLAAATEKFNIDVKRIFTAEGGEIDDVEVIRDNDILYVSAGEAFIKEDKPTDHDESSKTGLITVLTRQSEVQIRGTEGSLWSVSIKKPGMPAPYRPEKDRFVPKSSNEEDLRKTWYIWWANNKDVKSAFIDYMEQLRMFFNSYYLNWEEEEQHDILYQFFKEKNEIDTSETTTTSTDCELIVLDQCFPRPVYISKTILRDHKREYTSCNVNTLGYQHIFKHNMIDTSTSDTSSSCDDLLINLPTRKKRKTCQQALFVDCGDLLKDHMENSHHLKRPGTSMEILILCENSELCIKISKHLGLVFLDSLLYNSEIESYPYPVTQEQKVQIINDIDTRLNNSNAKLYDMLQSIVVKKLITGHNNVGLTCDRNILKYFGASIKCLISKDTENVLFCSIKPYLNMIVKLNNDGFLDYISAVGKIVDESVQCRASIEAVYKRTKDKKYCSVRLPIISILPMYVTNFFAVKKAAEETSKASLI